MTSGQRTLGAALLWLLAGGAGCDSASQDTDEPEDVQDETIATAGQTGDEGQVPWTPGGGAADRACPLSEQTQVVDSLEQDTELGFSAADILGLVGGTHEVRVHWNAQPFTEFYSVQVTPGDRDEDLELTVSGDEAHARYRSADLPDGGLEGFDCPEGQLELGLRVKLRSESGALDEDWWGTLVALDLTEAIVVLQAPTWRGRLPQQPDRDEAFFPNAQQGELEVVDGDDPGSALAWVDVTLRFRSNALDGSVNGWVQNSEGGAFLLPQGALGSESEPVSESAGYIGVIGDGFYAHPWAVY